MSYFSCAYGIFMPVYALSVTGLPVAVARLVAEREALGIGSDAVVSVSLRIFSLFGLGASILTAAIAYPFCVYVAKLPEALPSVLIISPAVFFGCVTSVYRGCYEGRRNMYPTALSQVAEALTKLSVGLALTYGVLNAAEKSPEKLSFFLSKLGFSDDLSKSVVPAAAAAAVLGITLSSLVGMLFLMLCHKFTRRTAAKKIKIDRTIVSPLIKTALPVAVGSLVTSLTSLIDLATITGSLPDGIVLAGITPENTAAFLYGSFGGLAITVFNLVPSVINMFGKGIIPSVAEAWALKDSEKLRRGITEALTASAFLAVPAGLGITVLSREILSFLYRGRELEVLVSARPLAALGAGIILLSLTTPVFSMLQAVGRADLPIKIMLVGAAVKLAGNLILIPIPEINLTGAGISTSLSYAVIFILALMALSRVTAVKIRCVPVFAPSVLSGMICAYSAYIMYNKLYISISNSLSLLASIVISCGIYLICALSIGYFARSLRFYEKFEKI